MKVLYKDEDENLAVMQVTKASYLDEMEVLELCGPEEDIAVEASKEQAEEVIRTLFENGKADVTAYPYCEVDVEFDEDDDDEDYTDDFDEILDRILDESEDNGILKFK